MSISPYSVTVMLSEADHQLLDAFAAEHQISDLAEALRVLLHESADLSMTLGEDKLAYPGAVLDRLSAQIDDGIAVWLSADFAPDNAPFADEGALLYPTAPTTTDFVAEHDDLAVANMELADLDFTADNDDFTGDDFSADTLQIMYPPKPLAAFTPDSDLLTVTPPVPSTPAPSYPSVAATEEIKSPALPVDPPAPPDSDFSADTVQIHPHTTPSDSSDTP